MTASHLALRTSGARIALDRAGPQASRGSLSAAVCKRGAVPAPLLARRTQLESRDPIGPGASGGSLFVT